MMQVLDFVDHLVKIYYSFKEKSKRAGKWVLLLTVILLTMYGKTLIMLYSLKNLFKY